MGGADDDWDNGVVIDPSGYCVIAGGTYSYSSGQDDAWVVKVNLSNGNVVLSATFGGPTYDQAYDIAYDPAGYYVITGETYPYGTLTSQLIIVKIDPSNGSAIWVKEYGNNYDDRGYAIEVTSNGNYMVGGFTQTVFTITITGF